MGQAVLTEAQKTALRIVGQESAMGHFYLSGGTALSAFYLTHRLSDDLDFFTREDVRLTDASACVARVREAIQATEVRSDRLHDRHLFFFTYPEGELKIEFSRYAFDQLDSPTMDEFSGMRIDSLRDIAANKLAALLDRFDPKDFVDLYFLLNDRSLDDTRRDAVQKFRLQISDLFLGSELAKVRRIEVLPKMLKPLTVSELKSFFTQQARRLKNNVVGD